MCGGVRGEQGRRRGKRELSLPPNQPPFRGCRECVVARRWGRARNGCGGSEGLARGGDNLSSPRPKPAGLFFPVGGGGGAPCCVCVCVCVRTHAPHTLASPDPHRATPTDGHGGGGGMEWRGEQKLCVGGGEERGARKHGGARGEEKERRKKIVVVTRTGPAAP